MATACMHDGSAVGAALHDDNMTGKQKGRASETVLVRKDAHKSACVYFFFFFCVRAETQCVHSLRATMPCLHVAYYMGQEVILSSLQ